MAKFIDLTGQKFGKLTVLGLAEERNKKEEIRVLKGEIARAYIYWTCKCECGGIIDTISNSITHGKTKDCGCMSGIKDIAGQKFGKFTVLSFSHSNKGTYWNCECECGNIKLVRKSALVSGHTISCGCVQIKDLTGTQCGRLTIIGLAKERNKKEKKRMKNNEITRYQPYWICKCICGNTVEIIRPSLINNTTNSCGCLGEEFIKTDSIDSTRIVGLIRKPNKTNNLGIKGVYETKKGKYKAQLGFKGNTYHGGVYDTIKDAIDARNGLEEEIWGGFLKEHDDEFENSRLNKFREYMREKF